MLVAIMHVPKSLQQAYNWVPSSNDSKNLSNIHCLKKNPDRYDSPIHKIH